MNKFYITILILSLIVIGYFCYDKYTHLNITVKFDDLEPFEKQMNVYYKGFKIGKTTKIYPDKDYKNTYIHIKLFSHKINLPDNIKAKIKSSKSSRYINIIYPDAPAIKRIKNDDIIEGTVAKDINSIINDDGFTEIVSDATSLIESSNTTVQNIGILFSQMNDILTEIRPDIIKSARSISNTAKNLENLSSNINTSLSKDTMKKSANNIKEITNDINNITKQVDKISIPLVNSILCNTNSTTENANEITCGLKETLKKRMGLAKLLFGRPIDNN